MKISDWPSAAEYIEGVSVWDANGDIYLVCEDEDGFALGQVRFKDLGLDSVKEAAEAILGETIRQVESPPENGYPVTSYKIDDWWGVYVEPPYVLDAASYNKAQYIGGVGKHQIYELEEV